MSSTPQGNNGTAVLSQLQAREIEFPVNIWSSSIRTLNTLLALKYYVLMGIGIFLVFSDSFVLLTPSHDGLSPENFDPKPGMTIEELTQAWFVIYNLGSDSSNGTLKRPILPVMNNTRYPMAPHLQDCYSLTKERTQQDMRNADSSLPDWAIPSVGKPNFRPPWIEGQDEDNLAYTRDVQTGIWMHQFPPNCSDPKHLFAFIPFADGHGAGIGSKVHTMSYRFWFALRDNRIAVFAPGSLDKFNIPNCEDKERGSWTCFFFPVTSPECESVALALWANRTGNATTDRIIEIGGFPKLLDVGQVMIEKHVRPWLERMQSVEEYGKLVELDKSNDELYRLVAWHHAQTVRFMFRYPSMYLCHVVNQVRHGVYGRQTARMVLEAESAMAATANHGKMRGNFSSSLEEVVQTPVHIPRPIVSMYVRVGDKQLEMRIVSFGSYMYLAEKFRRHVPNVRHIWLSTESEEVVDKAKEYKRWSFLVTENPRLDKERAMDNPEGYENVPVSLAGIIIASECDFFIGPLLSNYARMINELRVTNGRYLAGYFSVNYGEW